MAPLIALLAAFAVAIVIWSVYARGRKRYEQLLDDFARANRYRGAR